MSAETVKRRSKDSVFVDIFSDVNYVLELYRELKSTVCCQQAADGFMLNIVCGSVENL